MVSWAARHRNCSPQSLGGLFFNFLFVGWLFLVFFCCAFFFSSEMHLLKYQFNLLSLAIVSLAMKFT